MTNTIDYINSFKTSILNDGGIINSMEVEESDEDYVVFFSIGTTVEGDEFIVKFSERYNGLYVGKAVYKNDDSNYFVSLKPWSGDFTIENMYKIAE